MGKTTPTHVALATSIIFIIISLPLATVMELNDGWHKVRCHQAAQAAFPPHTLVGVSADYGVEHWTDLFSGPTECEFTLAYQEPGFGACWIWVDRTRAWDYLSGCYTQPPATGIQRDAARTWADEITQDGKLWRITVP